MGLLGTVAVHSFIQDTAILEGKLPIIHGMVANIMGTDQLPVFAVEIHLSA